MSWRSNHSGGGTGRRPRELTGRTVLFCLVGFFAAVAAVNAVMMTAAISTFSGVETANSYQAGITFSREEAASVAQEARHWQVNATLKPVAGASTQIELAAKDAANRPLTGLAANITLIHPNDHRRDHVVTMQTEDPGRFRGAIEPLPGQWDLVIELSRGGERLFRSKERIILR